MKENACLLLVAFVPKDSIKRLIDQGNSDSKSQVTFTF